MADPSPFLQDLFAYGTLMCEEIMASVAGMILASTPARLEGFRRFALRDEVYPGVIAAVSGSVEGRVYHHLPSEAWHRLDRFEGEMYDRKPVTVHYGDGSQAQVYCYLIRAEYLHRLNGSEWDFAAFLQEGKQLFLQKYSGFNMLAGMDSPSPSK